MRIRRRIADALSNPQRLVAFVLRVVAVAQRGELGTMLRRVRPRGPTSAEYRKWLDRQTPLPESRGPPFIIAVDFAETSNGDLAPTIAACAQAHSAGIFVRDATSGWRPVDGGSPKQLGEWARERNASWIWWIGAPLALTGDAAPALAMGCAVPGARVVYADHAVADGKGGSMPVFKPAWDRIQLLERPYAGPLLALDATLSGALEDETRIGVVGQWRFLLDVAESVPDDAILHVPRVVAQISGTTSEVGDDSVVRRAIGPHDASIAASRGVDVEVNATASPWLRLRARTPCPVSVVIPTRDRPDLIERCLRSLVADLPADGEVVVVDNGSSDPEVPALLQRYAELVTLRTVPSPGAFNFPRLCNVGVAASRGRVVVLLNNDTEAGPDSLDELVGVAALRDVGAAGPLLVYPDGILQSAGVLIGVNRTATSALSGFDAHDAVARDWCRSRRRVSAVLGACLAVSRDKYLRIGGMDERFGVSHNELDFCLRLDAGGLANVFTPFARVVHREGATRGFEVTRAERERLDAEEHLFRMRWGQVLEAVDPAYHPALARQGSPFSLAADDIRVRPRAGWRGGVTEPARAGRSS